MRALLSTVTLLALTACPKAPDGDGQPPPPDVQLHDPAVKREAPGPLEARPFTTPKTETRTLSNGLQVVVARNDEVPMVDISLAFRVGGWNSDVPGQAQVTFDMLNEGAGDMSAEDLSRKLKAMASDLSTGASDDGATVSITTLKRNLAPTLDLMQAVVREPTFPEEEWEILRRRYVAAVQTARKDPNRIAARVADSVFYGDSYRGRIDQEAHYQGMTPDDMRAWYNRYVGPQNAILLVGGDVTADEIVPLLEERFGSWNPEGIETPEVSIAPTVPDKPVLYLVDKPGAAQSVVRAMTVVGEPTDDDWFPFTMGTDVLGGTFMSRMNMNLREDKGYTYGARCSDSTRYGPTIALCSAGVQTEVTGPSLVEMRKEFVEIGLAADGTEGDASRPISADELKYMQDSRINAYPRRFETPGALLGEQENIWRYGLPGDWPERYLPSIEGVSLEQAQQALAARWKLDNTVWLVVGDKAAIMPALEEFGLPIVELDADGNRIGG